MQDTREPEGFESMNNVPHLRPPILTGKMDGVVFDPEKKIDVHCNAGNPVLSRLAGSSMGRVRGHGLCLKVVLNRTFGWYTPQGLIKAWFSGPGFFPRDK